MEACSHTGCRFAIVPSNSRMFYRIAVNIDDNQNITKTSLKTANAASQITNAVITRHRQPTLNKSFSDCHINSLEVYRGRQQVIEISHDGFSITAKGFIEV